MKCYIIVVVCLLGLCSACKKQQDIASSNTRTTIVYMIADNNLDPFSIKDINEMEAGFSEQSGAELIVYIDRAVGAKPSQPIIYKIVHDTTEAIVSPIVRIYPEHNSASATTMKMVLSDIVNLYPAQSYGLVLWSHGTAWYPQAALLSNQSLKTGASMQSLSVPLYKSFGRDVEEEMAIEDLASALPIHFDFIVFDDCFMASVEVAYALKDATDYIIASATEVLSNGYPYRSIVPLLLQPKVAYQQLASTFFEYYNTQQGVWRSATVAVIKTNALEKLALAMRSVMQDKASFQVVKVSTLQQYTLQQQYCLLDIEDVVNHLTLNEKQKQRFRSILQEVVIDKYATPMMVEQLALQKHAGLSMYFPIKKESEYNEYYKKTAWYKATAYQYYFDFMCSNNLSSL